MTTAKKTNGRTTPKKEKPAPITTLADFRALKKPVTDTLKMCADRALSVRAKELAAQVEMKEREMRVISGIEGVPPESIQRMEADLLELQTEATEAQYAADAASLEWVFRAMGGLELDELMEQHRPTRQQQADYQEQQKTKGMPGRDFLDYNPKTFPPVLLAGTLIQPEVTVAEAKELLADKNFSQGELMALLTVAWNVNQLLAQ